MSPDRSSPSTAVEHCNSETMNRQDTDNPTDDHSSPYPVSRLAPAFDLVDMAREIAQADEHLANRAASKMQVLVEQLRHLQRQAREILEETHQAQELHRARCNFQKIPGRIYHLYQDRRGELILSMLSPADWRNDPPNAFKGSFRLETDRSWTPLKRPQAQADASTLAGLLFQQAEHE